jgi:hypothetical protein
MDLSYGFLIVVMCFINVLSKVIINLKFYKHYFIKHHLHKHFCIIGWCLVRILPMPPTPPKEIQRLGAMDLA